MIGEHITLDGDTVTTEYEIVPEYVLEYDDSEWPHSGIDFWHWVYNHFEQEH